MNGVHDMGGMDGFGEIEPEANEPVFHALWEGRVSAITRLMGYSKAWNIDMFRNAREHQPPAFYLASSYYKSWERTIETLLVERGLATSEELAAGRSMSEPGSLQRRPAVDDVPAVVTRGAYGRPALAPALFKAGDVVRTKNINPTTHTRLPRYARGRRGTIERHHGCHVFADSSALGAGDNQQWLYTVVFEARELWGDDADSALTVSIDAFESYLERL